VSSGAQDPYPAQQRVQDRAAIARQHKPGAGIAIDQTRTTIAVTVAPVNASLGPFGAAGEEMAPTYRGHLILESRFDLFSGLLPECNLAIASKRARCCGVKGASHRLRRQAGFDYREPPQTRREAIGGRRERGRGGRGGGLLQ
jgi:hypothetical protein